VNSRCDKLATVVGQLLTTLATLDGHCRHFSKSRFWENPRRKYLHFGDTRISL